MAELWHQRRSALHGLANSGTFGAPKTTAGVRIREVKAFGAVAIAARRGRDVAVSTALSSLLRVEVADAPRRLVSSSLSITGVAPGQWLVVERDGGAWQRRLNQISVALADIAALTEQSDGKLIVEVDGPQARDALIKGVAIDLDPNVFATGHAAQTTVAHMAVQIGAVGDGGGYELISAASTAESFWSWLSSAAAEFGYEVA